MDKVLKRNLIYVVIFYICISAIITVITKQIFNANDAVPAFLLVLVLIAIISTIEWRYLIRKTDLPTKQIMKITVGTAVTPISIVYITDMLLNKDTRWFYYIAFVVVPIYAYFVGASRASEETLRNQDLEREESRNQQKHTID